MEWERGVTYAKIARQEKTRLAKLLDTLIELKSMPGLEDRYSNMSQWLMEAREEGLLNYNEWMDIRTWLGQHM